MYIRLLFFISSIINLSSSKINATNLMMKSDNPNIALR